MLFHSAMNFVHLGYQGHQKWTHQGKVIAAGCTRAGGCVRVQDTLLKEHTMRKTSDTQTCNHIPGLDPGPHRSKGSLVHPMMSLLLLLLMDVLSHTMKGSVEQHCARLTQGSPPSPVWGTVADGLHSGCSSSSLCCSPGPTCPQTRWACTSCCYAWCIALSHLCFVKSQGYKIISKWLIKTNILI